MSAANLSASSGGQPLGGHMGGGMSAANLSASSGGQPLGGHMGGGISATTLSASSGGQPLGGHMGGGMSATTLSASSGGQPLGGHMGGGIIPAEYAEALARASGTKRNAFITRRRIIIYSPVFLRLSECIPLKAAQGGETVHFSKVEQHPGRETACCEAICWRDRFIIS